MAWFLIILAGAFETAWTIGLKYSEGFTRFWPSILTALALAISMGLMGIAVRTLPIGTAYAIWVGIGAAGAVAVGIWLFNEPANFARLAFLALLIVAIVGLKWTAE